ncbi:MAG: hypothetical protein SFV54_19795, partial [Bryobacteraceae bacterium]|nr:hypothetical protein [Bryobacteraceae bacterium]
MARALDSSLVMENMEAAALAAKGIPWGEAEWLARQIGVTLVEFAALIGVSQPTLFRRRKE